MSRPEGGSRVILVAGATGLVGMEVCRRLSGAGERVRALVRGTSAAEKLHALQAADVELWQGDLKDADSLTRACTGVEAVISTASSTLSRQAGDSIETVDAAGQMNLVTAARAAGVARYIFTSFRHGHGLSFPLDDAKREVEAAITDMNYTVVQASWFMEVWLSPALGFDYENAKARILGSGLAPVSFVSSRDVAQMCVIALRHPAAARKTIEFGGPEALTPLDVVHRFEALSGKKFATEHVSMEALRAQYQSAPDSMSKTFAGLMLAAANGDAIDMAPVVDTFGFRLTSIDEYARSVLGAAPQVSGLPKRDP